MHSQERDRERESQRERESKRASAPDLIFNALAVLATAESSFFAQRFSLSLVLTACSALAACHICLPNAPGFTMARGGIKGERCECYLAATSSALMCPARHHNQRWGRPRKLSGCCRVVTCCCCCCCCWCCCCRCFCCCCVGKRI